MDHKVARWPVRGVALWQRGQKSDHREAGEWICAASRKRFSAIEAASVHLAEIIK